MSGTNSKKRISRARRRDIYDFIPASRNLCQNRESALANEWVKELAIGPTTTPLTKFVFLIGVMEWNKFGLNLPLPTGS